MALSILKELLQEYEKSLFNEGIINGQFSQIQALNSAGNHDLVVQLIDAYCVEVDAILSELESCIKLPDVDFSKLAAQARKVEEKSLCFGAEHVRLACGDLIRACEQSHMRIFSQAISWLRKEFSETRKELETFAQMERKIIRLKDKQQNRG